MSDGIYSATATITLDVRPGDEDGSWNGWSGCTIFVSAANCDDDDDSQESGYILINRGRHTDSDDEQSAPQLNWDSAVDDCTSGMGTVDNSWWHALLEQPLLNTSDIGKKSGLIIKKGD